MDQHLLKMEARLTAAGGQLAKTGNEELYLRSSGVLAQAGMDECALYGDTVAYLNSSKNQDLQRQAIETAKKVTDSARQVSETLFEAGLVLGRIDAPAVVYPEVVRYPNEIKTGKNKRVRVLVTNAGDGPAHDVVIKMYTGGALALSGENEVSLGTLQAGEVRELNWKITGQLREQLADDGTIISIMVESSNALSGFDMKHLTVLR